MHSRHKRYNCTEGTEYSGLKYFKSSLSRNDQETDKSNNKNIHYPLLDATETAWAVTIKFS